MPHIEKTVKQSYIYEGKIICLRKDEVILENDTTALREVVEHPGGVTVVPLCKNGDVVLVRQFRYPYMQEILEIPAGKLDVGEDPFACGVRELKEETGATAQNYMDLGKLYPTPGYCAEIIHMYLAMNLSFSSQKLDDDEFLDVVKMPLEDAIGMILSGEIKDAKTQTALMKVYLLKQRNVI